MRAVVLGSAVFLIGCAASRTSIESAWLDQTYTGGAFGRVVIWALFATEAESRQFEQIAAQALESRGVATLEAHSFLEPHRDYTQDQMERELARVGAEGLLMFRLIAVDERQVYRRPTQYLGAIPPGVIVGPSYYWYYYPHPSYYWYWRATRDVVRSPGYWEEHRFVVIETSLYDNDTDQLVWTAKSETLDDARFDSLVDSIVAAVSRRLFSMSLLTDASALSEASQPSSRSVPP
jgi:hypothetical protein